MIVFEWLLTFSIGWLDIDSFFLWLVKWYWLYVDFWLRLLLCWTKASFFINILLLYLWQFWQLWLFSWNCLISGLKRLEHPRTRHSDLQPVSMNLEISLLKSKKICNLPSVGNSCCLGAGPLFLCFPCLLRLSSSISSSDFSLKTSGGALQPKSSVLWSIMR